MQTNIDTLNQAELLDILSWYSDAGVTEALSEAPTNHFEQTQKATPPVLNTKTASAQRLATDLQAGEVNYENSIKLAQATSKKCNSIDEIGTALVELEGCTLKLTAKHLIFGQGKQNADIMFIGLSPARDEDMIGHAFAGEGGLMLDKALSALKLSRDNVWLSYLLPWRSLGDSAPSSTNIEICKPFLLRQIELIDPKIIITFDAIVYKHLTQNTDNFIAARGKLTTIKVNNKSYKAVPTYHPSLLLKTPSYKPALWQDLLTGFQSASPA